MNAGAIDLEADEDKKWQPLGCGGRSAGSTLQRVGGNPRPTGDQIHPVLVYPNEDYRAAITLTNDDVWRLDNEESSSTTFTARRLLPQVHREDARGLAGGDGEALALPFLQFLLLHEIQPSACGNGWSPRRT